MAVDSGGNSGFLSDKDTQPFILDAGATFVSSGRRPPQRDTSPAAGPRGTIRESLENQTLHATSLKV